ncbi:MAG: hypothetical protein AAGA92_09090 [Planctomycetota bacterium]
MRLTLRTLLAYMDDILEPEEQRDLNEKIEASDFASDLIHRIRDSVRRLRLGAPEVLPDSDDVLDEGFNGDANVTAEYLDNTLPPEQVPEFERVCLEPGVEADMYLAEAAACHQILRMVLVEPVEIDADMKRRLYEIPSGTVPGGPAPSNPVPNGPPAVTPEPEVAAAPQPPMPVTSSPQAAPEPVPTAEHELPAYLREAQQSKIRSRRLFIAAAAVLAIVGYFGLGALEEPDLPAEVAAIDADALSGGLVVGEMQEADPTPTPGATSETEAPAFDTLSGDPTETEGRETDEAEEAPAFNTQSSEEAAGTEPETEPSEDPLEKPSETSAVAVARGDDEVTPRGGASGLEDSLAMATADLGSEESGVPFELPGETGEGVGESAGEPGLEDASLAGSIGPANGDLPAAEEAEAEVPAAVASGPVPIGFYFGGTDATGKAKDVLLSWDADQRDWFRIETQTPVSTGDRLLNLPSYNSLIVLDDLNVSVGGATQLSFPVGSERPEGVPDRALVLELVYGHLIVNSAGGASLALAVAGDVKLIELQPGSQLGVRVQRIFVSGADHENTAAPVRADWYLLQGSASVTGSLAGIEDPVEREVMAADAWSTIDGQDIASRANVEPPVWVRGQEVRRSQGRARSMLAGRIEPEKPVGPTLLAIFDRSDEGRRPENRALIAEASLYVGEYEPFVRELGDEQAANVWDQHIEALRQALTLSPEAAAQVRDALLSQRNPSDAERLMKLIRGFSPEEIGTTPDEWQSREGVLSELISWLDDSSLDVRVLAYHNLCQITATKNLEGYTPTKRKDDRERAKKRLWARLDRGELRPAGP